MSSERARGRSIGEFRFSIIGSLLASPPGRGDLISEIQRIADIKWRDPGSGEFQQYCFSTIERWFYSAKNSTDPVGTLSGLPRKDKGNGRVMSEELMEALKSQYHMHHDWTWSLHHGNLKALADKNENLGPCPSYTTVRRYMKTNGMRRRPKDKKNTPGMQVARDRLETREVRSYEVEFVSSLWHLDYHHGSRRVLNSSGKWISPICLAIHDDNSRMVCHIQWYERETCENLVHGIIQAIMKRGLPRSLMTDNGSAMKADEFVQGLARLGILHEPCLPYSPYQNGKTERFWGVLESRLIPMIPDGKDITLEDLNKYTVSWAEMGYNRDVHGEISMSPLERTQTCHDVSRPSPGQQELTQAFRGRFTRKQRRSDGTVTFNGLRYEVPMEWRHQDNLVLQIARWNPKDIHIVDSDTDKILSKIWPSDKLANSDSRRRPIKGAEPFKTVLDPDPAPLLTKYLEEFAITGLPMPYLPKDESPIDQENL